MAYVGRNSLVLASTAAVALALSMYASPPADAYALTGCKFNGTDPVVTYIFTSLVSTTRRSATLDGAAAWNATTVPSTFRAWRQRLRPRRYCGSRTWTRARSGAHDRDHLLRNSFGYARRYAVLGL